ncbi:MAG: methyl-accepting chemotaxis protein [Lachnospiraceae bacterium]|nr:methyl-accepting chemotaxis protein [Lachnospiraceae bacterium]
MVKTLKSKIILFCVLVSVVGFAMFSITNTEIVKNKVEGMLVEKAIQETKQIGKQAEILLEHGATVEELQNFVNDQVTENPDTIAYAIVIDKTIAAIAHSDEQKIGKNYGTGGPEENAAVKGQIEASKFWADVQEAWTYDIMVPIVVNGQQYGAMDVGIYENQILNFISELTWVAVISVIVIMVLISIMMLIVCNCLFRSFQVLVGKCNKMGEGDFTEEIEEKMLKRKDEIGSMATALNNMRVNLQNLIKETKIQTTNIVELSEVITINSSSTDEIAKSITADMKKNAEDSEKQDTLIDETSLMVGQINEGMESVATNMQNVSETSTSTVTDAEKGYLVVENMMQQMTKISKEVNSTSEIIQALSKKSSEIESVVSFITGIATQTNLLALNASIEAARAGAQGKGFAVVAGEVGNLAEQSSKAANEIVGLIKEIQNNTEDSIRSMEGSRQSIEQGLGLAEEAGTNFQGILKQITGMAEEFTSISAIAEEVTASTNNLLSSVEEISKISKDVNAGSHSASESMEEQCRNMADVMDASEVLNLMATQLQELVKDFKL